MAQTMAPTTVPGMQPPNGRLATSPLNPQSTRPTGIPLGSTEIATPGISPVNPMQGMTGCAGSASTASPDTLFDGGGLAGGSSTNCAGGTTAAAPLPQTSTVGRVGIPLGSTEIGGAGISPTIPVPGPINSDSATSMGNP